MKKLLKLLAIGIGVAALIALTLGITVFAHGEDGGDERLDCSQCEGYGFKGEGVACNECVSEILGLTTEELCQSRQEGLSLADIAAENGLTPEEMIEAVMSERTDALQVLLDEGTITQEQMDYMLERMAERVELMLTRTATGPAEWGMGYSHQNCNAGDDTETSYRWGYQNASGACNGEPALFSHNSPQTGRHCGKNR